MQQQLHSYARIEVMKFKTLPVIKIYYTETDSIIIEGNLPPELIGEELCQMKDELAEGLSKSLFLRY